MLKGPAQAQLALPLRRRGRGGFRPGAGRKPGPRPWVPRRPRPAHAARHPVHVTLRARPVVGNLRAARVFPSMRDALRAASGEAFRIVEFSVQRDHVHLIVEARDRQTLIRGVQGLAIRLARAVNRAKGQRGRVWADRYHARALGTPREVRNALVYVLTNFKKHRGEPGVIDGCSSAAWFTGWRDFRPTPPPGVVCPVMAAGTWLLGAGWRRHGLIRPVDRPRARGSSG